MEPKKRNQKQNKAIRSTKHVPDSHSRGLHSRGWSRSSSVTSLRILVEIDWSVPVSDKQVLYAKSLQHPDLYVKPCCNNTEQSVNSVTVFLPWNLDQTLPP